MAKIKTTTRSATKIIAAATGLDVRSDPDAAHFRKSFEIAQMIYDARFAAGLTQAELAALVDTQQPVISQLENADYEGHSLSMLERIAEALQMKVELRLVPADVQPV